MADVPVTTIGSTGALSPGFAAVLTAIEQNYQSIYGSDADLSPDTQDGQLAAIFATAVSDLNDLCVVTYNAFSPATAQGTGLASVVKINGMAKKVASSSSVLVTCVGQANTSVGGLTLTDPSGNPWTIAAGTTIPGGGSVNATAICGNLGAISLASGVAMAITTPTPGFQSATTAATAVPGNPVENDAQLRQRQSQSTSGPGNTLASATLANLLALPGVTRATYDENATSSTDVNSVPAHSVEFVVEGGSLAAIAQAILLRKSEGCGTYGTTSQAVFDPGGVPSTINFTVLGYTQIYVGLTLNHLNGYVSTTAALIQSVIVAFINGLPISQVNISNVTTGNTVRYSKLYDAVNLSGDVAQLATGLSQTQLDALSATYDVTSLFIGTSPSPAGTSNINLTFGFGAQTNAGQVTVS